jgi:hypothetical protein
VYSLLILQFTVADSGFLFLSFGRRSARSPGGRLFLLVNFAHSGFSCCFGKPCRGKLMPLRTDRFSPANNSFRYVISSIEFETQRLIYRTGFVSSFALLVSKKWSRACKMVV